MKLSGQVCLGEPQTEEEKRIHAEWNAALKAEDEFRTKAFPKLVELMGEHLDEFILQENTKTVVGILQGEARRYRIGGSKGQIVVSPAAMLKIGQFLGLSDEQLESLRGLDEKLKQVRSELEADARKNILALQKRQFQEMMDVLTKQQRALFQDRIGDPMEWPLQKEDPRTRLYRDVADLLAGRMRRRIGSAGRLSELDSAALDAGDREHLEQGGFQIEQHLFWEMFRLKDIQQELELAPEQVRELKLAFQALRMDRKTIVTDRFAQDRLDNLLAGRASIPKRAQDVLLEHQKQRVLQIELQLRLYRNCYSFTLLSLEMQRLLGLNNKQVQSIRKIKARYFAEINQCYDQAEQATNAKLAAFQAQLFGLLDEDQSNQIQRLIDRATRVAPPTRPPSR